MLSEPSVEDMDGFDKDYGDRPTPIIAEPAGTLALSIRAWRVLAGEVGVTAEVEVLAVLAGGADDVGDDDGSARVLELSDLGELTHTQELEE